MPLRHHVLVSACAASLLTPVPSAALSSERDCVGPTIEADAGFRERFPGLLQRLRTELPSRANLDACAGVELRLEASRIVVTVALPDGRATLRDVTRREDVLPTLQALLLVPERAPAPKAAPPPARERGFHAPTEVGSDAPDTQPARDAAPRSFGVELSLTSGVRWGDRQVGYGAGVLSFIELERWLLGFQGRADGYRSVQGSDTETALTLGILVGRRFDFGSTALDVALGPALMMRGVTFSKTESAPVYAMPSSMPRTAPLADDVGPTTRFLVGARLGFSPHSVFRTFIGIDGEFGPRRGLDAPQFVEASGHVPSFALGLAFGATLGTR